MSIESNDREQLRGILREFDIGQVQSVIDELNSNSLPVSAGFKNQGNKCANGEDGCIGKQQFEQNQEAVWGQNNLISAHFLTEGAQVQKTVAMVTLKIAKGSLSAGSGWGSGFLISNSLFMTNNHVIPTTGFCNDVNMQFMYQNNYNSQPAINSEFFETHESSFFHTNTALDYTIVRLRKKPYRFSLNNNLTMSSEANQLAFNPERDFSETQQLEALSHLRDFITKDRPIAAFDINKFLIYFGYSAGSKYGHLALRTGISYPEGLRLNVIQHPQGRKKEIVVQQNELKDVHTNVIHYYSDTDYGSSGSPVFNNTWDLMALHHARDPSESANEGIRIDKIVADLRSTFQSSNPAILTELGI